MKTCTKCGLSKDESEFHKHKYSKDGLHCYCKECRRPIAREKNKVWRYDNPERYVAKNRKWKAENPDRVRETQKEWRRNNKGKLRSYFHNYRAKKISSGRISPDLKNKLYELQRGKCPCCGETLGDNYHLDHIMPLALGGTNTDDNIQLLRASCNRRKRAKHPLDFMRSKGFLL